MFFETVDGDLIPIARVRRIRAADRDYKWVVDLDNGEEVTIGCTSKAALANLPLASFPALPGTEVLRPDKGELFRYAVIGWIVPAVGGPLPVTIDGPNDGAESDEYLHVLLPDGKVYKSEDGVQSLEEFKRAHDIADAVLRLEVDTPGLGDWLRSNKKADVTE